MLKVLWSERAESDLASMIGYIAQRNPVAAESLKDLLEGAAARLSSYPYLHRVWRVPGTRESVVHPNYVLVYRVAEDAVVILRVLHARQLYP